MQKTIKVDDLKQAINKRLALDTVTQEEKGALTRLLSTFLHATGNYKGFSYLFDWNSLPRDEAKAIEFNRQYL